MAIDPLDPHLGFSLGGSAFASFNFFASLGNLSLAVEGWVGRRAKVMMGNLNFCIDSF